MYASAVEVNKKLGKQQLQPLDPLEVLGYVFYMSISLSLFAGIATGKIVKGTTAAGLFYATLMLALSVGMVLALPIVIPPYPQHAQAQVRFRNWNGRGLRYLHVFHPAFTGGG